MNSLLAHYFSRVFRAAGLQWNSDNISEIESIEEELSRLRFQVQELEEEIKKLKSESDSLVDHKIRLREMLD